ncbi:sugar nucleotide-binding protein [Subtercola endophyticus]|uniref:sugar nucleotide-binding protein n=1 Tax=Subtercola endophyticus TaxID=2895559 RepID=UPI001E381821|nr:bifunctional dTDP-4-dehydrorhamnose 3,5-epimerase family protein/NAD(P)-dependent oxidoreductase [Subtercola endophyticus]UFS57852.1 bifunctional dTDP-4-dehydrorhamnose 3,5-epimerase family protein/NAD(P)-dependent oxidoreductase [Subtercola endophyticus]
MSNEPASLTVTATPIPGLLLVQLPVHADNRGWFKENWQREKMVAAGLPDFGPVQNNVSFNALAGTTRGIHAEPWDKFVSVTTGRVFGGWVDLREGESFGAVFTVEIGPGQAVFVPRGVGNSYQTLDNDTSYSYLVNEHWSPHASYTFLNLADETVAIPWPIDLDDAELSEKDRDHPRLGKVMPVASRKVLVLGANGQLGRALRHKWPEAEFLGRDEFDLSDPRSFAGVRWSDYRVVVNASAFTATDAAETPEGRVEAWRTNVSGVAQLVMEAQKHSFVIVHVSSDYVFDGLAREHHEDEPLSPLSVYGQTKAAGDALVSTVARHYIVRTSWVVGDGPNFVRTMVGLAARGVSPSVVDDQVGRLTFTADIAGAIDFLLTTAAPFGTYNLSGEGPPQSWADVARRVFELAGRQPDAVDGVSTTVYYDGKSAAPRPTNSLLALDKIESLGFVPGLVDESLRAYVEALLDE